jgi:REP element-mobilizing transposase RayT
VTLDRCPIFANAVNVEMLRATMRIAKTYYPFEMRAYVFMPDHFHLLVFIPEKPHVSKLLHSIERNFTLNYKKDSPEKPPRRQERQDFL